VLPRDQPRQVSGFLLGSTVAVDLVDAQIGVRGIRQPNAARATGDLFHGHHVRQIAHARPAPLFADGQAQQAHVAEFAPQVGWKLVDPVGFGGARGDFMRHEGGHRIAQHVDFFAKEEIQSWY
jgi:hypothetical protein